jgi:hypothetical protein
VLPARRGILRLIPDTVLIVVEINGLPRPGVPMSGGAGVESL